MIRTLSFLFFFNISLIAISQNVELFYQPIIKDLKNDDWNNLRNNLDTLLTQHRNSLMVPFTLKAVYILLFLIGKYSCSLKFETSISLQEFLFHQLVTDLSE